MKVFLDLYHIPQYNFFRNTIYQLGPDNVDLGCVNRGKLVDIIKHECPEYKLYIYGDYKNNNGPFSMTTKIIIPRLNSLVKLFKRNKYDLIGTAHYQANMAARFLGIPNFSILDDPRLGVFQIVKLVTSEFYLPLFSDKYPKIKKFNALKEWAYLSPKYFKPASNILNEYDLKEKKYLFIREVATNTSNYLSQEKNLILKLSNIFEDKYKVVLSIENKTMRDYFPKNWIILKEPVSDIHSLMYYSKTVISSGDSMAREGAMLGVPSIYCGIRDMDANKVMIDKGMLFKVAPNEVPEFVQAIVSGQIRFEKPVNFRRKLEVEWDDVTEFIIKKVMRYSKRL